MLPLPPFASAAGPRARASSLQRRSTQTASTLQALCRCSARCTLFSLTFQDTTFSHKLENLLVHNPSGHTRVSDITSDPIIRPHSPGSTLDGLHQHQEGLVSRALQEKAGPQVLQLAVGQKLQPAWAQPAH